MSEQPGPDVTVNPIATCATCRTALAPAATSCDHCGAPRGQVPAARPPRRPAPAWLRADWALAALLALLVALALEAVLVAYGIGLGAMGAGGDGIVPGAILGSRLPYAAFGGELTGFSGNQERSLVLLLDSVPLVLTALAAGITWLALRPGIARLAPKPERARALVAKVALLLALGLLVVGGFLDVGGFSTFANDEGRNTLATVEQATAAFGALLVVGLVGSVLLVRAGVPVTPPLPLNLRRALLAARAGAAAYAVVALLTGLGGLLVLGAQADGARDRFAVAASAPLSLSSFGGVGSAVAHGGAAGSTDVEEGLSRAVDRADIPEPGEDDVSIDDLDPDDVEQCEDESSSRSEERACLRELIEQLESEREERGTGEFDKAYRDALRLSAVETDGTARVSLSDWELPLTDQQGRAPWWAFLSLLVPLAALVGGTLLLLRRAHPPTEGWALRLGLMLGLGYALACGLVAALSPMGLVATGSDLQSTDFSLLLVPALGSSLGLPMLWGAVVPAVTALVWSRRHGLPGNVLAGLGAVPEPRGGELLDARTGLLCPACGASAQPGDAFCAACGRPLRGAPGSGRDAGVVD